MKVFFILLSVIIFTSCNNEFRQYEQIINTVNRAEIHFNNKTIILSNQKIEELKKVLSENIKPELQRKFIKDVSIDLYKDSNRLAFLLITNNQAEPFINFNSQNLNFGFRTTYRIGMLIDNIK
jgi:hypothetical protein